MKINPGKGTKYKKRLYVYTNKQTNGQRAITLKPYKMEKMNICIVFSLGYEKAFLSRTKSHRTGELEYKRSKEHEFGYHEFKNVESFKASIKRYTDKYGAPVKVILNGDDFEGIQAETLCEFIINESI